MGGCASQNHARHFPFSEIPMESNRQKLGAGLRSTGYAQVKAPNTPQKPQKPIKGLIYGKMRHLAIALWFWGSFEAHLGEIKHLIKKFRFWLPAA